MKYVYYPALFLEVGHIRYNYSNFPKVFAILWPIFPKLIRRVFSQRIAVYFILHFIYIQHPYLLYPLHYLPLINVIWVNQDSVPKVERIIVRIFVPSEFRLNVLPEDAKGDTPAAIFQILPGLCQGKVSDFFGAK